MIRLTDMVDVDERRVGCNPVQLHDGTGRACLQQRLDAGRTAMGLPGILLSSNHRERLERTTQRCRVPASVPYKTAEASDPDGLQATGADGMQGSEAWLADKCYRQITN